MADTTASQAARQRSTAQHSTAQSAVAVPSRPHRTGERNRMACKPDRAGWVAAAPCRALGQICCMQPGKGSRGVLYSLDSYIHSFIHYTPSDPQIRCVAVDSVWQPFSLSCLGGSFTM